MSTVGEAVPQEPEVSRRVHIDTGNRSATFWAKTDADNRPAISVRDHSLNVGFVAKIACAALPPSVRALLPGNDGAAAALLASLHDVGKITIGFQAKCPTWLALADPLPCSKGEIALSVSDHALVSQAFLQTLSPKDFSPLWAVAVGAHHGRPKGRVVRLGRGNGMLEAAPEWAASHRQGLLDELRLVFGPLPISPPSDELSDLWLLAGLITVADWIGSNESWFSATEVLSLDGARSKASEALRQIGWPGGALRHTGFADAFATAKTPEFAANAIQAAVTAAAVEPGVIIVEGPMGCGKTEAALYAAQQLIASGHQRGIYFALPTQVTSNRVHRRIEQFLRNCLEDPATLRLAHGNAWLDDDFDVHIAPTFQPQTADDYNDTEAYVREARSWFSSAKRALLAPYGVGTIDQALQAVVAVKHFFVRRFALAGKVIILDEIHSYDIYTGTLITALIRELVNLRCSVIILSATLTAERRRELLAAGRVREVEAHSAYPLVSGGKPDRDAWPSIAPAWPDHRPIKLRAAMIPEAEITRELIRRADAGQHTLWIRNTVVEAQDAFRTMSAELREGGPRIGLLHSRFPYSRRALLEGEWLERLGKHRPASGPGSVLIATQVVEQSVDIDLDFIVSDLAPTDMLLQRVGRLWRHDRPMRLAEEPEFWLCLPDLSRTMDARELTEQLGRSARVYAPYVLLRTATVWDRKTVLRLPADIRPMLAATYAFPVDSEPDAWLSLRAKLEKEKAELEANALAVTRVLGNPMLDDHEDILTRRKGPPVVPVALLRSVTTGVDGAVRAVALDGTGCDFMAREWRRSSAKFLHQWIVRAPRWMVPDHPPRPPWLGLHGPFGATVATVGDDGRCRFDDETSVMIYDPRLGVYAERQRLTPARGEDSDDEFDS